MANADGVGCSRCFSSLSDERRRWICGLQQDEFPDQTQSNSQRPRSTCKPHSVRRRDSAWAIIYLRGPPGTGAPLEGEAHREASHLPLPDGSFVPSWPCSRRGLPGRLHYCRRRWSLTPPFHPCPCGRSVFCGPFPAGREDSLPAPGFPGAVLCGVRTFLDLAQRDRDRPVDLGHLYHTRSHAHRQRVLAGERRPRFPERGECASQDRPMKREGSDKIETEIHRRPHASRSERRGHYSAMSLRAVFWRSNLPFIRPA